ncbi:MAR1 protein, partial [Malurus elegans]|nr:MAR1 protein [Malurus elegans]
MPRRGNYQDGNYYRGKGHTHFAADEALGIGLFILVLAILLAFGCWYYRRRSGYKSLRVCVATHFQSFSSSFQLPHFYDLSQSKSFSVSTIRNVVGEREPLDCKMALQEYKDFNSVVPDAPPAYDKIAADQSPPPYSP